MRLHWTFGAVALLAPGQPVSAQDTAEAAAPPAFVSPYAGPEIGGHEHHFYLDVTDARTGEPVSSRYYRAWGVGGGAFAGYDLAVSDRVRLGVEVGVSLGGDNPVARLPDGTTYTQHPRWGYRATGKAGYVFGQRLLAYGSFGYGGHHYRLRGTAAVADAAPRQSSFTIGGGFQHRIGRRADLRLDFCHLDNSMSSLLVGVPIRF